MWKTSLKPFLLHIFRELNQEAGSLSKEAQQLSEGTLILKEIREVMPHISYLFFQIINLIIC
jgi:hypothetical protein